MLMSKCLPGARTSPVQGDGALYASAGQIRLVPWGYRDLSSSSPISGSSFKIELRANAEKNLNAVLARRGLLLPS